MRSYIYILFSLFLSLPSFAMEENNTSLDFGFTRGKDISLWPLIYREKNENINNLHLFFSIYRNSQNYTHKTQFQHLLPLYVKHRKNEDFDWRFLSLYYPSVLRYMWQKENEVKTFQFLSVVPKVNLVEIVRSRDKLISATNVFPIMWYRRNEMEEKSHLAILPIYFERQDRNSFSRTIFPLYSYGKNDSSAHSYFAITPLYWQSSAPNSLSKTFFPLVWYKKEFTTENFTRSFALFPLVWNESKSQLMGNNPEKIYSKTYILPTITHTKERSFRDAKRSSEISKFNIHPILYHSTSYYYLYAKDSIKSTDVVNKTSKFSFIPLLYFSKKASKTYINTNKTDSATTVLQHYDKHLDYRIQFPIYWQLENSLSVLPFFSHGKNHLMLTPLFWHTKNKAHSEEFTTLFPLYWNRKKPDFYFHSVMPFYGYGKSTTGRRLLAVTPLFWDNVDTARNRRLTMLLPLAWRHKKPNYLSHGFMPFYGYSQKYDHKLLATTPFIWNFWDSNSRGTYIFPVFWNKHKKYSLKTHKKTIAFPIWWSGTDTHLSSNRVNHSHHVLFPIVWHFYQEYGSFSATKKQTQTFTVFPIFWSKSISDLDSGYNKSNTNSHHVLFPFFWKFKTRTNSSLSLLPLWHYSQNKELETRNLLITPLFLSTKSRAYESRTLLPLFSVGSNKEKTKKHLVVTPLWWSGSKSTDYGTEKYRVLFPLLYTKFTPHYRSTTVFPLFSIGHNANKTQRHLAVTPLFWDIKNGGTRKQMLLPLYYVKQDTVQQKNTVNILGLLYDYRKNNNTRKHNVLFPIVAYSHGNGNSNFRLFPFIWKKQSKSSRYFHLIPFYSQLADSITTSRYFLGPLYVQQRGNTEHRNSVLWFLFQWNTKEIQNDYQFRILYSFIYNEHWDGVQTYGVMPFFHISKNENSGFSKNFGLGFYNKFRRKVVGYENEFYEETRIFWFLRIRSNYQHLKLRGVDVR